MLRLALAAAVSAVAALPSACNRADPPAAAAAARLELVQESDGGWVIELDGLGDEQLSAVRRASAESLGDALQVFTLAAERRVADRVTDRSPPAVLGSVVLSRRRLRWAPTFPLAPGQVYRARWEPLARDGPGAEPLELRFALPGPEPGDPPRVVAIHPDVDTVPANLLRAYVHFSRPMRPGHAAEHLVVLADGDPLDGAFVAAESELWNPEQDRLTLLFDPGRIKQEVGPNLDVGAPLQEGMELELRVEPGWPARDGVASERAFTRRWSVGPPDRARPSVGRWRLVAPAEPRDAVTLRFPGPLDHALVERMLRVESAAGKRVAGRGAAQPDGRGWSFRPAAPWQVGEYRIRVRPELEDLAGNNLERLFDEPLDPERVGETDLPEATIPFEFSKSRSS